MKKVFLSLAVVALLASCGAEGTNKEEGTQDTTATAAVDTAVVAPEVAPVVTEELDTNATVDTNAVVTEEVEESAE